MTTAGAVLCVLRARFFRLEVRLFGTAMGLFWEGVEVRTRLLLRGLFHLPKGVPSRVGFLLTAIVRSGVEIRAAPRTHASAVLSAQREAWCGEQPLLADRRSQVEVESLKRLSKLQEMERLTL